MEFRPLMLHARAFYRREFADRADAETLVSRKLAILMQQAGVTCACGRNMILNMDSREDFLERAKSYPGMAARE
jgi:hypothetical protein